MTIVSASVVSVWWRVSDGRGCGNNGVCGGDVRCGAVKGQQRSACFVAHISYSLLYFAGIDPATLKVNGAHDVDGTPTCSSVLECSVLGY